MASSKFYIGTVASVPGAQNNYIDIEGGNDPGATAGPEEYVLTTDYAGGNKTAPRAWGALACCYLGQPAA